MKKFTFKTIKATGKYSSFYNDYHIIKLNKKEVGSIGSKYPHKIRLMVVKEDINEDGNPNCDWKWITLRKENNSVKEAKEFINRVSEKIQNKYNLKF